jgi:hypothetical protein
VMDKEPANDDDVVSPPMMTFSDLAIGLGLDEDTLLRRFADILNRREPPTPDPSP